MYCNPRDDNGPYTEVELGFPSEHPGEAIMKFAENPDAPLDTVYGYVPVFLVRRLIASHGGEAVDLKKVALSASYYNIPVVLDILKGCDVVFTTNQSAKDALDRLLGPGKVFCLKPVPYEHDLKATCRIAKDAECISFSDLRRAIKAKLAEEDQETARLLLDYCGWNMVPTLLYDEEGIEGYQYVNNNYPGECWEEIGDTVPTEVIKHIHNVF
jgi:hypothetical protein